jgi:hypothetical protein
VLLDAKGGVSGGFKIESGAVAWGWCTGQSADTITHRSGAQGSVHGRTRVGVVHGRGDAECTKAPRGSGARGRVHGRTRVGVLHRAECTDTRAWGGRGGCSPVGVVNRANGMNALA